MVTRKLAFHVQVYSFLETLLPQHIDPLPTIIVKEKLDDEDVLECQKAIYHVVGMETRNEPLPSSSAGPRGKGPKR